MWKPNNQNGFTAQPRTAYVPTSTAPQQQFQPQNVPPAQQPVPQNAPMPVQNQAYPQNQYSGASRQQPQQYQQNNSIPSAPPAGYQPPSAPVNQVPQNGNAHPPQQNSAPKAPSAPGNDFINAKITWMDGKDKKLDFSDCLIKANPEDYANIHGCGGKGHAPNSSICLTLCDYSKGTGDKSVTVKVNLDVRYIDTLLSIAQAANSGMLGIANQLRGVKDFSTANGVVIGWLQSGHQPTMQELAGLQQTLCNGLVAQDPGGQNAGWSDGFQKNSRCHFPLGNAKLTDPATKVVFTEGPLKADIASALNNDPCIFMAVHGVNNTKDLYANCKKLKEAGISTVYNAFDMDRYTNPNVREATKDICDQMEAIGLKVVPMCWGEEHAAKMMADYSSIACEKGIQMPDLTHQFSNREQLQIYADALQMAGIPFLPNVPDESKADTILLAYRSICTIRGVPVPVMCYPLSVFDKLNIVADALNRAGIDPGKKKDEDSHDNYWEPTSKGIDDYLFSQIQKKERRNVDKVNYIQICNETLLRINGD